jgi:dihydrofolate reductase
MPLTIGQILKVFLWKHLIFKQRCIISLRGYNLIASPRRVTPFMPFAIIVNKMGKVFFDVAMSLDGFIAGPNRGPRNPLGDGGTELHRWMWKQKGFLERIGLDGGETNNKDNDIVEATFGRTDAYVLGKRMFEESEANWPENPPFRGPVFIVTHQPRDPWERKGGTTFYFVNDGIYSALEKAKQAAGGKDVRIGGGANIIQQFLKEQLIDEFRIHLAPVMLNEGVKLFDHLEDKNIELEKTEAIDSSGVTHLRYDILRKIENVKVTDSESQVDQ